MPASDPAYSIQMSLERPTNITPYATIGPRTSLTPLIPPPVELADYPILSMPKPPAPFGPGYQVSTHVFPAAYPRCPSNVWVPPPVEETANERKTRIARTVAELGAMKEAQEQGRDDRAPRGEVLWMVAKRYVKTPRPQTAGLTLVLLHGVGALKEIWEPILARLLTLQDKTRASANIEEIWSLDAVQHGDSGIINEKALGNIFDNADYARDVANFMLFYLPEEPTDAQALPTCLPRLPVSVTDERKLCGYAARTIVAAGHSMGAHALIYPAVEYPSLFSSLVLIEAANYPTYLEHKDTQRRYEAACLGRRWLWDTRENAVNGICNARYFASWHPNTLQHFCQHALVETADGKWRLKTHPYLESLMLFERRSVYETWEVLDRIHPRVFLHWIWGGKSERTGGPLIQAQTTYRRAVNCSNDYHPDHRHNIPHEAPDVVAADLAHFINRQYGDRMSRL